MISFHEHLTIGEVKKLETWYFNEVLNPSNGRGNILEKLQAYRLTATGIVLEVIDFIFENFDSIIIGLPILLEELKNEFNNLELSDGSFAPDALDLTTGATTNLRDDILVIFGYSNFRSNAFSKEFTTKLGVKTCPYCMSQFTMTKSKLVSGDKMKLFFELDHFYPRTFYPFLSMSLYNLIPSCSSCNGTKSKLETNIDLDYHPWMNEVLSDYFIYKMTNFDIAEKYINNNHTFEFDYDIAPGLSNEQKIKLEFHIKKYSILGQVERHSDIAEELAWKKYIYVDRHKTDILLKTFNGLFDNMADLERFIVGNYTKPQDHLKRPLAKFQTDLAKQMKLI